MKDLKQETDEEARVAGGEAAGLAREEAELRNQDSLVVGAKADDVAACRGQGWHRGLRRSRGRRRGRRRLRLVVLAAAAGGK